MTRIHWSWQSAVGVPPIAVRRRGRHVATTFGRWLAERIASLAIDFPDLAFHRVVLAPTGIELVLIVPEHKSATRSLDALRTQLVRETTLAAQQCAWIAAGPLWEREAAEGGRVRRREKGLVLRDS